MRFELRASTILEALVTLVMDAGNASSRSYFPFDIFNELNELFVSSSTLQLFPLSCVNFIVMISLQFSDPVSSLPQPQLFFMTSATSFILANALLHVQNPNLEFDFINFHLMKKGVSNISY